MNERSGFKKGEMIVIVGSGSRSSTDLLKQIQEQMQDMKVAMIDMGEAGRMGAEAGFALRDALAIMPKMGPFLPEEMNMNMDFSKLESIVMDFSKLESIVLDSFPSPVNFAGKCISESTEITKKAMRKLRKQAAKINSDLEPKTQKEIWANKWNKKIKKKL